MVNLILRLFILVVFMNLLGGVTSARAEIYLRSVNFEWEPIEGAQSYELIIRRIGSTVGGKDLKFKLSANNWSGRLTPGHYEMSTRSLDSRGVPGEWSPNAPFDVTLEKPVLLTPKDNEALSVTAAESAETIFSWQPVGGATSYQLEVASRDGIFKFKEETSDVSLRRDLPVAKQFKWKLKAIGPDDLVSEVESGFSLVGARIEQANFELPENEFVRELKWTAPEYATSYDIELRRLDASKKKWDSVAVARDLKEPIFPIDQKLPGGTYQATMLAKGELRKSSPAAQMRFRIRHGDRSPASEFTAEIRKSIDRVNGWYGVASYLITVISYSSTYFDNTKASATKFSAIGGTGRLGLGYFLREKSWGFLGIGDLSGFTSNQEQNLTYAASELSAVWRRHISQRTELRLQFGGFYKEQPVAIGDATSRKVNSYSNVAALGPHLGVEFWYSLTAKLGFQFNGHLYQSLSAFSTPNGQPIEPTLSSQVGFLGSYRLGPRATGLMGWARRDDRARYLSTSGKSNDIEISGNYLNFFLEYGF